MQVTQELVTVLADPVAGELNIVLGGYRLALSAEEAASLAEGLAAGLERLRQAAVQPSEPWQVQRAPGEAEAMQSRTRALIQATMREKGLTLREERE
jgi:hypothetical protein